MQASDSAHDVFSISDAVLSEKLQFVNEIGSGNWGSVWLCRAKPEQDAEDATKTRRPKLAVKLVHRAKTTPPPQTDEDKKTADAASKRVKTLWSEMKIVRTLNEQPHPSIINFQSFIITPSFAMIAMPYLPQLIPVEVPEPRAKEWLKSLLSAVDFCHRRGVVHNDIKPANIMISSKNVPVLIDFGFAERYDASIKDAFISNLHYGTPEYISPERAGGLPHDTRKSDVWSLGVTLFEILVGRTPFEQGESEQFISTEDLKRYWLRTIQGKWMGSWTISGSVENMLRCMLNPNADLRYTAGQALLDPYWSTSDLTPLSPPPLADGLNSQRRIRPKRAKAPSVVEILSPWATRSMRGRGKENAAPAPAPQQKTLSNAVSSPRLDMEKRRSAALAPPQVFQAPSLGRAEGKKRAIATRDIEQIKEERASAVLKAKRRSGVIAPPASTPTKDLFEDQKAVDDAKLAAQIVKEALASVPLADSHAGKSTKPQQSTARRTRDNAENQPTLASPRSRKPFGPRTPGSPTHSPTSKTGADDYFTSKRTAIRPVGDAEPTVAFRTALIDRTTVARGAANVVEEEHEETREFPSGTLDGSVVRRMLDWQEERSRMKATLGSEPNTSLKSPVESQRSPLDDVPSMPKASAAPSRRASVVGTQRSSSAFAPTVTSTAKNSVSSRSGTLSPRSAFGRRVDSEDVIQGVLPSPTEETRIGSGSALNLLKQSLKVSMNFAESTFGHVAKRSTPALAVLNFGKQSLASPESWADEVIRAAEGREADKPTEIVMDAPVDPAAEKSARMAEWALDVKRVVESARHDFEQYAAIKPQPVPTLPLPPMARRASHRTPVDHRRESRMPRKMLAANHIFAEDASPNASYDTSGYGGDMSNSVADMSTALSPVAKTAPTRDFQIPSIAILQSPARRRRNTLETESPAKAANTSRSLDMDRLCDSPCKRKDRSRSSGDLLQRHIAPKAQLNYEIDHLADAKPAAQKPKRLSDLIDSSIFIASPRARSAEILRTPDITITNDNSDDLMSSPFQTVEPYPSRPRDPSASPLPDTPSRLRTESVYDRFLMSTSGVKRVGSGYQSVAAAANHNGPVGHLQPEVKAQRRSSRMFATTSKRPMPPPVSSEDVRRAASVDELGTIGRAGLLSPNPLPADESSGTVWRALKAATTRRMSRVF